MKKILALVLSLVMILGLATGCNEENGGGGGGGGTTAAPAGNQPDEVTLINPDAEDELVVWSFTGELRVAALAFVEKNPNVALKYEFASDQDGVFEAKVDSAIISGSVPDVVALEAAFVRKYVEHDTALMSIEALRPALADARNYEFMVDIGIDPSGTLKALSWQATPGGFVYKRSVADKYLGVSDPDTIAERTKDMAAFEALGLELVEKAQELGGAVYLVGSIGEFLNPAYANRTQPWIVDNTLTICPSMRDLLERGKRFSETGIMGNVGTWSDNWSAAINGELQDADGTPRDVFGFFLSTWGVSWLIPGWAGATQTIGDWGLVPGPLQYSWGGTWAGVMSGAPNPDIGMEFVKFAATDVDHLTKWALGEYTNEYLKQIDPSIPDDVSQGSGDFLVSRAANEIVAPSAPTDMLGGQNPYLVWAPIAEKVNQDMLQGTNGLIQRYFDDTINGYIEGDFADADEALEFFRDSIRTEMPDLNW